MTGLEMTLLRRRVRRCGYDCYQFHYHSILAPPARNAARLDEFLRAIEADVIHIVAHSLGGVVVMHLFSKFPAQKPGRVLLLGSPLKGSFLAHMLNRTFLTRPFLGRATEQGLLGDGPRWKGGRELAMIAGTHGFGMGTVLTFGTLPKPNDGTVTVSETDGAGVGVHLQVPYSHFGMLVAEPVAHAVCQFLSKGDFAE